MLFCRERLQSVDQKSIWIDACITRGERALMDVPKLVAEPNAVSLVCLNDVEQMLVVTTVPEQLPVPDWLNTRP